MKTPHLDILSGNLDLVEFRMMEIRQQAFPDIQRFLSWTVVQTLLVSIMQTLHTPDVFAERYLMRQKVLVHDLLQLTYGSVEIQRHRAVSLP